MFFNSLPLFFNQIKLGSPMELLLIILLVYLLLYLITPFDNQLEETTYSPVTKMSLHTYLLYGWAGQLKLLIVFWPFFILLNISLYITDYLAITGNFTVSSWDEIHFILVMPILLWTVCVWRTSINTKIAGLGAAARLMTLTVYFEYALKLIIRDDYPRLFFTCQDILLDYGVCF